MPTVVVAFEGISLIDSETALERQEIQVNRFQGGAHSIVIYSTKFCHSFGNSVTLLEVPLTCTTSSSTANLKESWLKPLFQESRESRKRDRDGGREGAASDFG